MYITINLQAVTVTTCLASATVLTFLSCSETISGSICQCNRDGRSNIETRKIQTQTPAPSPSSPVLIISRTTKTVTLLHEGKAIAHYPVAVGKPGWETPAGHFTVVEKIPQPAWKHPITGEIVPPGPQNPMGTHWIGFWETAEGNKIGLHGTNNNASIGTAASHGCIRMQNTHIEKLYSYVQFGTQVIVK